MPQAREMMAATCKPVSSTCRKIFGAFLVSFAMFTEFSNLTMGKKASVVAAITDQKARAAEIDTAAATAENSREGSRSRLYLIAGDERRSAAKS